jgi:hypothetical protein
VNFHIQVASKMGVAEARGDLERQLALFLRKCPHGVVVLQVK